jgi:hypothetical protein
MPLKKDEEAKDEGFTPTFPDEGKPEERIYWARAAGLSIANFQKEKREGEAIVQPEASLDFNNHIKVTDDPAMIKFIEESQSFRDSRVKRVATLEEAYGLTAQVRQLRQIREISSSVDEKSPTLGRR